ERTALATLIVDGSVGSSPGVVALARPLLRAMLRDAGIQGEEPPVLDRLRARFGDPALQADWPSVTAGVLSGALTVHVPKALAGTLPIRDAALLPGGKALVALGEAGIWLLSRAGKTLRHFEEPATELVLSSRGDRALALAPRGRLWRVARLDLLGWRSRVWQEVELTAWSPEFRGASWLVGVQGGLLCEIDALDPEWSSLWKIHEPHQQVVACWCPVQDGVERLAAVFEDSAGNASLWQWDQASRGLHRRDALPAMEDVRWDSCAWVGTSFGLLQCENFGRIYVLGPKARRLFCVAPGGCYRVVAWGELVGVTSGDKVQFWAPASEGEARQLGSLTLEGATEARVHFSPFGVAVADSQGRLVSLVVDHGGRLQLLRTLRIG
ncbi:MAG: hypothetical protein RMJ98_15990, partial [Myxococcales bacterium]|nr:hypothetical protein [Myxococcales bacterium]